MRFVYNNDGGGCYAVDEPMDVLHLQQQVDMLVGTQVDTLCWNIGLPGAYRYDTKVSTRWGQGLAAMSQARFYRVRENLEALLRRGIDPLAVVLDRGRAKGVRVYPSVRISDCQMGGDLDPLNREHPEWRIGEHPRHGPSAGINCDSYLSQLDCARPEVRDRLVAVAAELLDRYHVEGIELDFQRRPHFFKPDQAVANRHLMTDMLRRIRAASRRAGEAAGRPVEILCRIWMDLSDCWNLGLDVRTWVAEGLIDVLIPTNHYFFALDYPVEEHVALAAGTPVDVVVAYCPVLNQLPRGEYPELWSVRTAAGRPVDVEVPYVITNEMWQAAAHTAYTKGADGLAIFNFNLIPRCGGRWDLSLLNELADPAGVARQNKCYPYLTGESRNRPQALGDDPVAYALYVADDPTGVSSVTLQVYITQTTVRDRISFHLNGRELAMTRRLTRTDTTDGLQAAEVDPHHFFECELTEDQVHQGANELIIRLLERNPELRSPLTVVGVNIEVAMP